MLWSDCLPPRLREELRLHQHNRDNRRGKVSKYAQTWFQIKDVFPQAIFSKLIVSLERLPHLTRNEGAWRSGSTIDGRTLMASQSRSPLLYLMSDEFASRVREETGIIAKEWTLLGKGYSAPGFCTEFLYYFAAEGLVHGTAQPDEDERIIQCPHTFDEVEDLLDNHEINDAKTVVGYSLLRRHLQKKGVI